MHKAAEWIRFEHTTNCIHWNLNTHTHSYGRCKKDGIGDIGIYVCFHGYRDNRMHIFRFMLKSVHWDIIISWIHHRQHKPKCFWIQIVIFRLQLHNCDNNHALISSHSITWWIPLFYMIGYKCTMCVERARAHTHTSKKSQYQTWHSNECVLSHNLLLAY